MTETGGSQTPEEGGDIRVGDFSGATGVAIGVGARAAVYQGLSVEEVAALVVELKDKDQPTVWDGRMPYLGLRAFQESDYEFFFGRGELVDELLERLKRASFITTAGPSGSGKSSVARAGLFHALREGGLEGSEKWLLATMQPKGDPLEQLALAMARAAGSPKAADYIRENWLENPLALHEQVEALLSDDERQRCVLLVDQFEEVFTQTKDGEERAAFINLLTSAALVEGGRTAVVILLRSDFASDCASFDELRALISQEFQLVGAMAPRDLAKAITLPSLEVGAEIDPALVKQIIDDMKGEPGTLPLMSFALRDLFEAEKTAKGAPMDLTLPEYLERGGIESALERHANEVFAQFSEEQRELAKSIFGKLITVGEGRVDTRRTAVFEELVPAGTDRGLVAATVHKLAEADVRLVTTSGVEGDEELANGQMMVTLAHEKLIDAWPWLRQLVDENRELILLQNQIQRDARDWAVEEDPGFLYRGGRLLRVEENLEVLEPSLDELSLRFVQESIDERQRLIDETEAQRRRTITILSAAAIVALGLAAVAFFFFTQSNQNLETANIALTAEAGSLSTSVASAATAVSAQGTAEAESTRAFEQAQLANVRTLVAQAEMAVEINDPKAAYLHSLRALDFKPDFPLSEAEVALARALIAFPDKPTLTGVGRDRTARIWDETAIAITALEGHIGPVESAAFNHDASRILTTGCKEKNVDGICTDGFAKLWDGNGAFIASLEGHTRQVVSAAFNHDGSRILTASLDMTARLWDGKGNFITALEGHTDRVVIAIFNRDGSRILTAAGGDYGESWDTTARLWDREGNFITALEGHKEGIVSATFNQDGSRIITASLDGTARLWDGEGSLITVLESPMIWVNSAVFNHDGSRILTTGCDEQGERAFCVNGTARLWNEEGNYITDLEGHRDQVISAVFNHDGSRILTAGLDRTARIWDGEGTFITALLGHTDRVVDATFNFDGSRILTASDDGTAKLWDREGNFITTLEGHTDDVNSAIFSHDNSRIITASDDGTAMLWEAYPSVEVMVEEALRRLRFLLSEEECLNSGYYDEADCRGEE